MPLVTDSVVGSTAAHRMNTPHLPPCDRLADCRSHFSARLVVTLVGLESERHTIVNDSGKLKVLFHEMTEMCL